MGLGAAAVAPGRGPADLFVEFAGRYSAAVRARDNARHTDRGTDRRDAAISMMKALEHEFGRCFLQIGVPNFDAVEAAARGDMGDER